MAKDVSGSDLDDLNVRPAQDPSLGLTNVGDREPEDWAADTGPTRTAESSGGVGWDQLRSRVRPSADGPARAAEPAPATLEQCLVRELQDLYQAESEQTRALGKLAESANARELKSAFEDHLAETQQQVQRLEQILESMSESAGGSGVVPTAVAGLITESGEKIEQMRDSNFRDLIIIAEAQKMEHNEIACYGTARAIAHTLGRDQEADLLQTTLKEEERTDKKLSRIALKLMKKMDTGQPAYCEVEPGSNP